MEQKHRSLTESKRTFREHTTHTLEAISRAVMTDRHNVKVAKDRLGTYQQKVASVRRLKHEVEALTRGVPAREAVRFVRYTDTFKTPRVGEGDPVSRLLGGYLYRPQGWSQCNDFTLMVPTGEVDVEAQKFPPYSPHCNATLVYCVPFQRVGDLHVFCAEKSIVFEFEVGVPLGVLLDLDRVASTMWVDPSEDPSHWGRRYLVVHKDWLNSLTAKGLPSGLVDAVRERVEPLDASARRVLARIGYSRTEP